MEHGISIVEAKESDIPGIENVLMELINSVDSSEGIETRKIVTNCRTLMGKPDSFFMVAKDNDTVVGFIAVSIRQTLLHKGPSGLIDEFIVTRGFRGEGIGQALLEAAIERCRALGCCEVEVSTEKSNREAREFYRRYGFQEEAVLCEIQID